MALTDGQKRIGALLAQHNPDSDYMIRLANDNDFAIAEITEKVPALYDELLKEKQSHESHIVTLNDRLSKIAILLSDIEELTNGNE